LPWPTSRRSRRAVLDEDAVSTAEAHEQIEAAVAVEGHERQASAATRERGDDALRQLGDRYQPIAVHIALVTRGTGLSEGGADA